jgi:hypothetical protein
MEYAFVSYKAVGLGTGRNKTYGGNIKVNIIFVEDYLFMDKGS